MSAGDTLCVRVIKAVVAVSLCPLVIVLGVTGCGASTDEEVAEYLETAMGILDELTSGLVPVREQISGPLAEQAEIEEALADFRKALSDARGRIDTEHAPEPCRDLDRLLRVCVDRGRDVATASTQFAEYAGQVAPLAADTAGLIESMSALTAAGDQLSALAGLEERADKLAGGYLSVIVPPAFEDVHGELLAFVKSLSLKIGHAAGETESLEEEGLDTDGDTGETPDQDSGVETRTAPPARLPAGRTAAWVHTEYQATCARIGTLYAGLMESTGYNGANARFDQAVLEALELVEEVRERHGSAGER